MEESLIDIILKLPESDQKELARYAKPPKPALEKALDLINGTDSSSGFARFDLLRAILRSDQKNQLTGDKSMINTIFTDKMKEVMGLPPDIVSYVFDRSVSDAESRIRREKFNYAANYFAGNNNVGGGPGYTDSMKNTFKTLVHTYVGVPKVSEAVELSNEYNENFSSKLKSGDAATTITIKLCPGIDTSKSPFEIYKKAYEDNIRKNGPVPDPTQVLSDFINNPEYFSDKKSGNTPSEKESTLSKIRQNMTAWLAEKSGTGGYDPDLFVRGSRLDGGTPIGLDFGTVNGRYGKTEDVLEDAKKIGAKNLAEYVEEKINFSKPPNEIYTLMNSVVGEDGHPLAMDGNPLDYNYYGIDPTPGIDNRRPMELSQDEKDLRLKIALKKLEPDLAEFGSEFEKMKEAHSKNIFYKMKPTVLKSFFTAVAITETWKAGKVWAETFKQMRQGLPVPDFGTLYHQIGHDLAQFVGYAEVVLGIYKIITGISNGKYGDATRDAGFGVIGAIAEWTPSTIGLGFLEAAGAGGLVGIFLTVLSVYMDYVMSPIAKKKNDKLLDSVLDLERLWIEKECCVRIHPSLYRKSNGQILIPIMTSIDPNSITGIDIPVGDSYERGWEMDGPEQLPCQQGSNINTPKRATVRRTSSKFMADPNVGGKTGLSGIPQTDKCKTPPKLEGSKTTTPDKLSLNDAIPYWNNQREIDYQDSMYAYNMEYVQREYQHKIDAAYCRSGIIQAGGSGAGYLDPAYDRGERIPVNFGDKFIPIYISRETLSNPVRPGRKTTEEWGGYWEREYGDSSGTDNSRGRGYGPVIPRGGGGGGGPTKEDTGEETGGLIRKPRRPV